MVNTSVRVAALIAASLAALSVNAPAFAQGAPAPTPAPTPAPAPAPAANPAVRPSALPGAAVAQGGKITFESLTHDFGQISDDKPVEHVFKFTNTGTGTLEILQASGSCGCTVPALTKRSYAPGESGEIKVVFNPHNRRDKQHTQVTVTSNDQSAPAQILHVHSFVKPLVRIDPQAVSLGQIEKGKGAGSVVVFTSRKTDLRPIGVTSNNPVVSAVLEDPREVTIEGEPAVQATIRVNVLPNTPVGPVQSTIAVMTSDPTKTMSITVLGEVIGEVMLVPPRISIGGTGASQAVATQVQVSSRSGKPFTITKVEEVPAPGTSKMLNFELVRDDQTTPPRWTVKMSGNTPATNGAFRGEVVLSTDLPGEDTIRIPYFGFVRGGANPAPTSPVGAPAQSDPWRSNPPMLLPN